MFEDRSGLLADNPPFRGYGAAVTPGPDGPLVFVAGFGNANRVLRFEGDAVVDTACGVLADDGRHAIGVAAADLDADGREEVYVHNVAAFGGTSAEADLLLDPECDRARWRDLFADPVNRGRENYRVGRSVAAVDRLGTGRYGLFVTGYGAPARFYEVGDDGGITDLADAVGLDVVTGGRSVAAGPIISERTDLFVGAERGPNLLLRNVGGKYVDVAREYGVADSEENARGAALVAPDGATSPDIVCGNWNGANRLFAREGDAFRDAAPADLARPARVRTVVAADFDNDGRLDLFVNCLGAPNRLLTYDDGWTQTGIGDASEPEGMGTGAAVADLDGDGTLELLVVHGEAEPQSLSLYRAPNDGDWLRVRPLTPAGAPARGARVTLRTDAGRQVRIVDAGSGYLCQMEPVAHFGLGSSTPHEVAVRWPDGRERTITDPPACATLRPTHPGG
ncbi:CRTAC1 family protein [Haloplanus halophilus]|uniref:CRTAC1 family protein n=1 Tax=Haloplanus halophilus TaxID=2949993 RepID=UPI00203ADC33|nr:CRTAC1 family protein [Haloplanus sp. GDY1]